MKKFLSLCLAVLMTACLWVPCGASATEEDYSYLENVALGANIIGTPGEGTGSNLTNGSLAATDSTGYAHAAGLGIDLVIDLQTAQTLEKISVYTRADASAGDGIVITASETGDSYVAIGTTANSASKTTVAKDGFPADLVRHDFAVSGTYRYIKLARDASSGWVHISGFAAYARKDGAAVPAHGNVARGKTVSGTHGSNAAMLVDGDEMTVAEMFTAGVTLESVIDFGGSYPLEAIRLCGRTDSAESGTGNSISVELSQTAYFDSDETVTVVPAQNLMGGDHIYPLTDKTKTYRYLRLKSIYLYLPEVCAYIAHDTVSGNGQGNIAYNKPIFGAGGFRSSYSEDTNILVNPNSGLCQCAQTLYAYAQVDLLDSYNIGKIVVQLRENRGDLASWKIVASNDFDFSTKTELTATSFTNSQTSENFQYILELPNDANYRYLRLENANGQYGVILWFAVYAKGQNTQIKSVDIKDTPSDPKYSIERFESVTLTPGYGLADSVLIAATYDNSGNRVGFKIVTLDGDSGYKGVALAADDFTVTFDWAVACPQAGGTVRVFLWNSLTGLQPIAESYSGTVSAQQS